MMRPISLVTVIAALALSGCSGATANTVTMTDANQFAPASISVPKGTTITWKNNGQTQHTIVDDPGKATFNKSDAALPNGAQAWDSGFINGGQSFSRTFDVPGEYVYFCLPHEALGMVGKITVTG